MSPSEEPRWAPIPQATEYAAERAGESFSPGTMRRWAVTGRVTARRVGGRRLQVDLNSIDAMLEPLFPAGAR